MTRLSYFLLEPISAVTHFVGAIASVVGLILLLTLTRQDPAKMLSMLVYGLSMVILFAVSTLLHGVKTTDKNRMWLNRLDHAAIFLVIAGTYTPIAFITFPDPWRWGALALVWLAVFVGGAYKMRSPRIHGFLNTSVYVIFGWGSAVPFVFAANLLPLIPTSGLLLLLLGGFIYTVGFFIYYSRRPDPWPGVFGHHELWHLFVLAGSLCHFFFILLHIVPFERAA
jgi:hemolysin III